MRGRYEQGCPEAEQVGSHICSYAVQFNAFVTPYLERALDPVGGVQDKPAKLNDLMPFTVLVHDTAIHLPGMTQDIGFISDADVDEQSFWGWNSEPCPQRRYYDPTDPYAHFPVQTFHRFRLNQPITFMMRPSGCIAEPWFNIDPPPNGPDGFNSYPYQGNLRYRHGENNRCNVGFADGRVEAIQADFYPNGTMKRPGLTRKSFMIKWPKGMGIEPNPSMP